MDSEYDRRARDEKRTIGCHRRSTQSEYHRELRSGSIMWWPHDHRRTNAANIKRPASMRWLSLAEKEFEPEGFAGSRDRAFIAE